MPLRSQLCQQLRRLPLPLPLLPRSMLRPCATCRLDGRAAVCRRGAAAPGGVTEGARSAAVAAAGGRITGGYVNAAIAQQHSV